MLRVLVVVASLVVGLAVRVVHADTVALLPLDSEKRLEIYGQPVASEIGRALQAQGVDVVVVGAKMDVPDRAQLIVDGTIKADKKNAITLSIRIRDPHTGTVLETLPATAATLTTIDKAAAELSARIVPAVKAHLAELAKATQPTAHPDKPVGDVPIARPVAMPAAPVLLVAVSMPQPTPVLGLLGQGLGRELGAWATAHERQLQVAEGDQLSRKKAVASAGAAHADLALAFDVLTFSVEPGKVPLGRARVRARVVRHGSIVFERVIRTDTIVGDKDITEQEMAARTAREVLAILNAQLRRLVEGWR